MQICMDIQDSVPQVVNRIWCLDSLAAVACTSPVQFAGKYDHRNSLKVTVTALDYPCDVRIYVLSCGIPYCMSTIGTAHT